MKIVKLHNYGINAQQCQEALLMCSQVLVGLGRAGHVAAMDLRTVTPALGV